MTDLSSRKILGQNQLTYQRLKVSLSLNLRRQIFVAVCDDLVLRDRLAAQLQAEFAKTTKGESRRYPRLVSLTLDLSDPNPIVQVAQWLRQFPPPTTGRRLVTMPAFQIMGVEHLTRQSAATQRLFFTHLQSIERSLPLLESSLLIWITQPWFRALPQSAPEFWRCRTGVFEFSGDPTPLPASSPERIPAGLSSRDQVSAPVAENPWIPLAESLTLWYESDSEPSPEQPEQSDTDANLAVGETNLRQLPDLSQWIGSFSPT
ncbi:MAG: hypothetical protein MUF49_09220, partial [Oculatellaceae cyanobacterium Prado106]|nr:hypothetical protein [Oculatellaceae cyanobacterium Prado106]